MKAPVGLVLRPGNPFYTLSWLDCRSISRRITLTPMSDLCVRLKDPEETGRATGTVQIQVEFN